MFDKFQKIKNWAAVHKKTSIVLGLVLIFAGFRIYQNITSTAGDPKYILTTVKKGAIITTVTGSGQVSANNQIDIQSKASGNITAIYIKPGQIVTAGTLLAQVDSQDASLTLQSAQISYDKLVEPAKPQDLAAAKVNINTAYNDSWNAISAAFVDYPSLITSLDNLFYTTSGYLSNANNLKRSDTSRTYIQKAGISYDQAKTQYGVVLTEYNSLSRLSATTSIDLLLSDTQKMVKTMADALKNTQNAVSYISEAESDTSTNETTAASNVNSWLSTINNHLSSLLSSQSNIANGQNTLNNLTQGADPLDVAAQKISLQKQQLAYQDYFIRAPFDGTIARVPISVGSPSSGTIATIVSNQKIAIISLNEVDVSKIAVGDKVNLTFDAIDGLNITGEVAEIDLVGTVSSGVVNYSVKINFDTQDDRVKSGMSVNASVITESKQDILIVPSSSVKSQDTTYYVDYFDQKYSDGVATAGVVSKIAPLSKEVTVGLSDDTNTEIISGLNEGDQIVSRTVTTATAAAATAPSLFGSTSNRGGTTNAVRRIGG
jgi:HlyD family secretion protein